MSHWDLRQFGLYSISLALTTPQGTLDQLPPTSPNSKTASWIPSSFMRTDYHTAAASSTQRNFLSEQKDNIVEEIHEVLREWIPSVISKEHVYLWPELQMTDEKHNQTSTCSQIKSECMVSYWPSSWLLEFLSFIGSLASPTNEPGIKDWIWAQAFALDEVRERDLCISRIDVLLMLFIQRNGFCSSKIAF